jgi:hypothetical protein
VLTCHRACPRHVAPLWKGAIILGALLVCRSDRVVDAAPAAGDRGHLVTAQLVIRGENPEVYVPLAPPADLYKDRGVKFHGRARIEVPGAMTVNEPPYVCDLEGSVFEDKGSFVAHLRTQHSTRLRESQDPFVVEAGQVHFVGK